MIGGKPRPILHAARSIPIGSLEWQDFQLFVCACLEKIGPRHGFELDGMPAASGDGGFDAHARRLCDGASVCIQCKRNESRNLTLGLVGQELAKVAMTAWLEGSNVKEHYFICSGGVSEDVRSAQREVARSILISHAQTAAQHEDLKRCRDDVAGRHGVLDEVIRDYVAGLDKIVTWSGGDLDVQVSVCFSDLSDVINRFFQVHVALREHPRPDFDEPAYLARLETPPLYPNAPLAAVADQLPPGFRRSSAAEARRSASALLFENNGEVCDALAAIARAPVGAAVVACGDGGAGKSTLLRASARKLAALRRLDSTEPLPLHIELRGYRGSLDDLIHRSLGVHFGTWTSMPGRYVLFLDGINELDPGLLSALSVELDAIDWQRVGVVISARPAGLATPLVLGRLAGALRLLPPDARGVRQLAESVLARERVTPFVDALQPRVLAQGGQLFELPFGILMAAEVFARDGAIPDGAGELVEEYLDARHRRNEETARAALGTLADVAFSAVRQLARRFAFRMLVTEKKRQISSDDTHSILAEELAKLHAVDEVGAAELTATTALRVLVHHELLGVLPDRNVALPHDIIAGWLASLPLAEAWLTSSASLNTKLADDAWTFAASLVPSAEHEAFIKAVLRADLGLAARCATTMSSTARALVEERGVGQLSGGGLARRLAARALGVIGTTTAIHELEARLPAGRDQDVMEFHEIAEALLIAGHRPTLARILEGADRMSSMPGIKASGGEVYLWSIAPGSLALSVARDRIDSTAPERGIFTSLRTVAAYGDLSDVPRLSRIVETAGDISVVGRALDAMSHIDPEEAKRRASVVWNSADDDVRGLFAPLHVALTGVPDIGWAVRCVCAPVLPGLDLEHQVRTSAVNMLRDCQVAPAVVDQLRGAFASRTDGNASWLWSVMNAHPNEEATAAALAAMDAPGDAEFGWACNYAMEARWGDAADSHFRERVRHRVDREPLILTSWGGARLVDYLIHASAKADAARFIEQGLQLIWNSVDRAHDFDHRIRLDELLRQAACIPGEISTPTIEKLLLGGEDVGFGNARHREACVKLAAKLDAAQLEGVLDRAADARGRAGLLAAMIEFEPTEKMRCTFRETLAAVVPFDHLSLAALRHPVRAWWCDETLSAIVDAFVGAEYLGMNERHFLADIVDDVGGLITRAQYAQWVAPRLADDLAPIVKAAFGWWEEVVTLLRGKA